MDIDVYKKNATFYNCYKFDLKLLDNLNIEHHPSNPMVILWNKYQIFIYENASFKTATKVCIPDYQVHRIICTKNYLLCLDINRYVHISTLKLKNPAQKQLQCAFQPKDQGIINCVRFDQDHSLSLKYAFGAFTLCLNKISADFHVVKEISLSHLQCDLLQPASLELCILTLHEINEHNFQWLEKTLDLKQILTGSNNYLVVFSCDRLNVFACLFDMKSTENEISTHKLCTCPSEICELQITDTHLLIGLKLGTIMSIKIDKLSEKPDTIHLNTALHKISVLNEALVYTDGISMWTATNIINNINLRQFFLKNVYDFIKYEDKLVCTTFTKLIYTFDFGDEKTYLATSNEYLPAEKLLTNSDYLNKILHEAEEIERLSKKCTEEDLYITALSLSRHPDIINNLIKSSVTVYENYEQIMKENVKLTIIEDIGQYFEARVLLFLIRITFDDAQEVSALLKNIIADIDTAIHISLMMERKILKTTSIKIDEPFTKANYLIPLQLDPSMDVNINIKLVTKIPGAHDMTQSIWTVLYENNVVLSSEQFIQMNVKSHTYLKEPKQSIEELIIKSCENLHGNLFNFTQDSKQFTQQSLYVALPKKFEISFLNSRDYLKKYLSDGIANFLIQQFTSDEFLLSKTDVILTIGKEKVSIQIENDGISNPQLKVTSDNSKITLDIRNFLSNMIYGQTDGRQQIEFINNSFYTTVENFQKAVKSCITRSADCEEYLPLVDQFEKNIIGMMPL